MTNATLGANAPAMPITRRLFIASGTGAAVFAALRAASLPTAAPVVARAFNPAAYVAMWERCGNIVFWDAASSGRESIALYFPDAATFPDCADLRTFNSAMENERDAMGTVVAYLKSRGQKAGQPLSVGDDQ